ncbi:endoribonuclease YbeY-like [Oculina patagonica]
MVVWIRNIQKRTVLNLPVILKNCNTLVDILRISHFDVNLMFAGRSFIKSLNLRYRRRNVVTDILAFPYFENLVPGVLPPLPLEHDYTLGDIVLGTPRIVEDCEADGKQLDEYLPVIITHGLCHLLGYTHDTQNNLNKMRKKEIEVLTEFNRITGYNTVPITPEKVEHFTMPMNEENDSVSENADHLQDRAKPVNDLREE